MLSLSLLSKIQGASGLFFALFLVPHLLNTVVGALGEAAYDDFQAALRRIYMDPVFEALTLLSIVVHLAATLGRKMLRRNGASSPNSPSPPASGLQASSRQKAHSYSGYVMTFLVGGHVISCRFDGPSPHAAGVSWVQSQPFIGPLFTLYFVVFAAAGCAHVCIGIPKALRQVGLLSGPFRSLSLSHIPAFAIWAFAAACAVGVLGVKGGYFTTVPDYAESPFAAHHRADPLFSWWKSL